MTAARVDVQSSSSRPSPAKRSFVDRARDLLPAAADLLGRSSAVTRTYPTLSEQCSSGEARACLIHLDDGRVAGLPSSWSYTPNSLDSRSSRSGSRARPCGIQRHTDVEPHVGSSLGRRRYCGCGIGVSEIAARVLLPARDIVRDRSSGRHANRGRSYGWSWSSR